MKTPEDIIHEKWSQLETSLEMAKETLKQIQNAEVSVKETIVKLQAQIDILTEVYTKMIPEQVSLEDHPLAEQVEAEVVPPAPSLPQT